MREIFIRVPRLASSQNQQNGTRHDDTDMVRIVLCALILYWLDISSIATRIDMLVVYSRSLILLARYDDEFAGERAAQKRKK